ncbi:hypothetical protein SteCoe_20575 [Stentor coeruleus]|uniref:Uncharacterized protein n=1 Tax=Stentor coeruleus TaxID=5963 RepID=A0A1R2BRN9_9CILI|nr:hypothetical protein SteCoe_20575 [Stentor coeruleus]
MSDSENLAEKPSEHPEEEVDEGKVEKAVEDAEEAPEGTENPPQNHENDEDQEENFKGFASPPESSPEKTMSPEDPEVQANTIKQYQQTLQDLKEEISRLTKKLDQKSKEARSEPSEEELFKLKCMCKYAKQEVNELKCKLEDMQQTVSRTEENVDNLRNNSLDHESSIEKIEDLNKKLKDLEEEYQELAKSSNEINIADLDKILVPEANLKLVNEFFVNVQKRLGQLETENSTLSATLKKNTLETNKLKEKCDKASSRYRSNDELKNKLRELEENYMKYTMIEEKLNQDLKVAEEEFAIHHHRPENKHDTSSAQKMLDDLEAMAIKDKDDIEQLEFQLQEKRNLLRAARAYGLQRSKTSNKLRSDMELLGLVLVEKDQLISKLRKEIDEIKLKQMQVDLEIKNLNEKKKQF